MNNSVHPPAKSLWFARVHAVMAMVPQTLRLVWGAAPFHFIGNGLLAIDQGNILVIALYTAKIIILDTATSTSLQIRRWLST